MADIPDFPIESYAGEPKKLPYPVRDNASFKYGQPIMRTQMDDGHSRVRRRWDQQPANFNLQWNLSWDQLAWFEAFLKYDCALACGQFNIALSPGGTVCTLKFTSYPSISFVSGVWQLVGTIESILNGPVGFGSAPLVLPTWPSTLPEPEQESYSITRPNAVTRSNITSGLATQRQRFSYDVGTIAMTFLLDANQKETYDNFIANELIGGLAPFQGYFANGTGTALRRMQFVDVPTVTTNGAAFVVTAQMDIADIPQVSEFIYRGLGQLSLSDSFVLDAEVYMRRSDGSFWLR
jgi:hypothetical protein